MGGADQRPAAKGLLRQRPARRDGGGCARFLRDLFRDNRRTGLLFARLGRYLEPDRARSAGGVVSGSADAQMSEAPNSKLQAPGKFQMTKLQNRTSVSIAFWNLKF